MRRPHTTHVMSSSHLLLAGTAGVAGSLASVAAKFVFGDLPDLPLLATVCRNLGLSLSLIPLLLRGICVGLTVVFNGAMWSAQMKALSKSGSSVQVLAVNTACNFMCTTCFGYLLFGDDLSFNWFFGAFLMVLGVILMNTGEKESEGSIHEKEQ